MNPVTTANKLKKLRNLMGFSQEKVAQKAELNLEDYKAMEMGKEPVSIDRLKKVCHALDIDFKEWFDEDEKSLVFVNNGEVKVDGNGVNANKCENCYYFERGEEDKEILKSLASMTNKLAEQLNIEVLIREMQEVMKKNENEDKKK